MKNKTVPRGMFRKGDKVKLRAKTFTSPDKTPAVNGLGNKLNTAVITGFDRKFNIFYLNHKLGGYHSWSSDELEVC